MPSFGKIQEFDLHGGEDWGQYMERMEHYFVANDVDSADKKRAILLSACGGDTYKLMCDLLAPAKPGEKTFNELKEAVKNHLQPKPSEIVQRFKFHTRLRKDGESVSDYVTQLRHLSQECNFGTSLDSMLRDRLVCGVNNDRIQRRLLSEKELTFAKALEIATAMELAERSAADIQGSIADGAAAAVSTKCTVGVGKVDCAGTAVSDDVNVVKKTRPVNNVECWFCHAKGHVQRQCREYRAEKAKRRLTRSKGKGGDVKIVDDSENDAEMFTMFRIQTKEKPYLVTVELDGIPVEMEIDTGASLTIISEETLKSFRHGSYLPVQKCTRRLKTYTGQEIPVLGTCQVAVKYKNKSPLTMEMIVVKGGGPSLLGRDWLKHLRLDWREIFSLSSSGDTLACDAELEKILQENQEIFQEGRGTIKGVKATIVVDSSAQPRYFKPRPVPYALREKVSQELDRMEAEGTIEKVTFADWAAPIVTVVKPDKSVRICGDYKVTVNAASKLDNYPIPKTDDLLAELSGGEFFSKLDLTQAYQQLELEETSKDFTTINTHRGLYRFNRLPYGVSSAPGIFQRTMENLLRGIANVHVRIDDILVAGKTREEHLKILKMVLQRLKDAGARLKKQKCVFLATEVIYLGLKIDQSGVQPVPGKVQAIQDMPCPADVKQLQAFLGMVNYYSRFLPNLSTVLAPLYSLLQKGVSWSWGEQQEKAWVEAKELLQSPQVLVHFDSNKDIILSCDASNYGVGAVISHRLEDGSERPIVFASRTMNCAELNYSQVEKEALAIIFGVKKFHQYLYGRSFEIHTDHKPLLGLFRENKQIPAMAAARIQRWALTLSAYEYTIKFKEGKKHNNADGLSRLPQEVTGAELPEPGETVLLMEQIDTMPVTAQQIRLWTSRDPVLSRVKDYVLTGWPEDIDDERFRPYMSRKDELSVSDGCVLWGTRVVVPPKGQENLLEDLHESHPGMSRMKALARSYVWWPNMDSQIETTVRRCQVCQTHRNMPNAAPLHPWEWPNRPWSRLHVDYAGPFLGKMFLVIIDAHSKWIDAYPMNSCTSSATVEKMRQSFAIHGLPEVLVSDNGSCFTSEEFEVFMRKNGIKHIKSAPYHAATNGLAERAVQTLKQGLRKVTQGSMETRVSRFLSMYRVTPQTTTGLSPAELLFNRKVRTRLDLVQPSVERQVVQKQFNQKLNHDRADIRSFQVGDLVFVKNFTMGPKWLAGVVMQITGPLSYMIQLPDGRVLKRHVDHVLPRVSETARPDPVIKDNAQAGLPSPVMDVPPVPCEPTELPQTSSSEVPPQSSSIPDLGQSSQQGGSDPATSEAISLPVPVPHPSPVLEGRPSRQRRLPARLKDFGNESWEFLQWGTVNCETIEVPPPCNYWSHKVCCQRDEIEALSAIYSDEWCVVDEASHIFCIQVVDQTPQPNWTLSLQIHLPEDYPLHSPPMFQINAPWLRGTERQNLEDRLSDIYCENLGEDLIYLWVEAIREHLQNKTDDSWKEGYKECDAKVPVQSTEADDADADFDLAQLEGEVVSSLQDMNIKAEEDYECPKILHGDTLTDRRSTFQPHLAPVFFKQQIKLVLDKLMENKKIANATHNMVAYRIVQNDEKGNPRILQGCDDDGETHAGSRMLHLLQIVNAENVMVVVSRWYGGIHLGPDRFKHISNCTRLILEQHGYLAQRDEKKGPWSGKKGK